jgi:hypothetical protein
MQRQPRALSDLALDGDPIKKEGRPGSITLTL